MSNGAAQEHMARLRGILLASNGQGLDDVSRARIKRRLMRELDHQTDRVARARGPGNGPNWRWTAAVAAVALAVLSGLLLDQWRTRHPPPANLHQLVVRSVTNPVAGQATLKRLLGRSLRELSVPAGASVRAAVGTAGVITALGGSRVTVTKAGATNLEMRLHAGTLAVQVFRAPGRRFVVLTPGGTVSVVGTNFAVQVLPGGLGVAVERGMVVVRPAGRDPVVVQAGQSWTTSDKSPVTIPAVLQRLLVAHRAGKPVTGAQRQLQAKEPVREPVKPGPAKPKTPGRTPPPATAEALYTSAEAALRAGKHDQARQKLRRLVSRFPGSRLCDSARYDLARLAVERGKPQRAKARLEEILARGKDRSLRDPARFMLCRIEVKAGAAARATLCLDEFRRLHPLSPHDQEALHLLSQLRLQARDCDRAAALAQESLRRYPKGLFSAQARHALARCAK